MLKKIILSIDTDSFKEPNLLGLDEYSFEFEWLKIFTSAQDLRNYVRHSNDFEELWIVSNDDIEAINLAAAIKKDKEDCIVKLVSANITGSLKSRAKLAQLDSVINYNEFRNILCNKQKQYQQSSNSKDKSANKEFLSQLNKVNITSQRTKNKETFVLSVMSASGGSGKSTVSALMAYLSNRAGFKTLLIDADLQFGDCGDIFGRKNTLSIDDIYNDVHCISNIDKTSNELFVISSLKQAELADQIIEIFPKLLEKLKSKFEVIIINSSSYWNEIQALLIENDSKSIMLIDQRPSSIKATTKLFKLCSRCGIATSSINLVLNRCSKQALFSSLDISYALKGLTVFEILDGGSEVDQMLSTGNVLQLINDRNPILISLWNLFEKLLPAELRSTLENKPKNYSHIMLDHNKSFTKRALNLFTGKRA